MSKSEEKWKRDFHDFAYGGYNEVSLASMLSYAAITFRVHYLADILYL